jgi:hypothetical protein
MNYCWYIKFYDDKLSLKNFMGPHWVKMLATPLDTTRHTEKNTYLSLSRSTPVSTPASPRSATTPAKASPTDALLGPCPSTSAILKAGGTTTPKPTLRPNPPHPFSVEPPLSELHHHAARATPNHPLLGECGHHVARGTTDPSSGAAHT